MSSPSLSLGSNQVLLGGMIAPASETAIKSSTATGKSENAMAVATALESNRAVQSFHYPGLESHAGRAVAQRQMRLFGGMVSFEVKDEATALRVLEKLEIFALAESLGAVESLAEHPARMTHASIPEAERKRSGVGDGLIRLSIGVEDAADLVADLEHALAVANA